MADRSQDARVEEGAEGKRQQVFITNLMSKQGKHVATSCLALVGSKLVRLSQA